MLTVLSPTIIGRGAFILSILKIFTIFCLFPTFVYGGGRCSAAMEDLQNQTDYFKNKAERYGNLANDPNQSWSMRRYYSVEADHATRMAGGYEQKVHQLRQASLPF